jgi:hypothetical protein
MLSLKGRAELYTAERYLEPGKFSSQEDHTVAQSHTVVEAESQSKG